MADNTTLPGIGDVIADEDIGGVKYQKVKLVEGTAGVTTLITPLQEGTDISAATMPAGGAHGRGWLSALYVLLTTVSTAIANIYSQLTSGVYTLPKQPTSASSTWTSATTATIKIPTGGCSSVFFLWGSSGTPPTVVFKIGQDTTTAYTAPLVYDAYNNTFISATVALTGAGMVQIPTYGAAYVWIVISVALTGADTTDVVYGSSNAPLPIGINKVLGTVTTSGSTLLTKSPVQLTTRTAATTNYVSATLDTPYGRGIQLVINVSSAPGGGQTLTIQIYSITGTFGVVVLNAPNVVNGTGSFLVELYPGVTTVAATAGAGVCMAVSRALADQSLIVVNHSGAGAWTYTVQYCLIP